MKMFPGDQDLSTFDGPRFGYLFRYVYFPIDVRLQSSIIVLFILKARFITLDEVVIRLTVFFIYNNATLRG